VIHRDEASRLSEGLPGWSAANQWQPQFDATISTIPHSLGGIVAVRARHEHESPRNVIRSGSAVKSGFLQRQ
jgi:hypothetical protein